MRAGRQIIVTAAVCLLTWLDMAEAFNLLFVKNNGTVAVFVWVNGAYQGWVDPKDVRYMMWNGFWNSDKDWAYGGWPTRDEFAIEFRYFDAKGACLSGCTWRMRDKSPVSGLGSYVGFAVSDTVAQHSSPSKEIVPNEKLTLDEMTYGSRMMQGAKKGPERPPSCLTEAHMQNPIVHDIKSNEARIQDPDLDPPHGTLKPRATVVREGYDEYAGTHFAPNKTVRKTRYRCTGCGQASSTPFVCDNPACR